MDYARALGDPGYRLHAQSLARRLPGSLMAVGRQCYYVQVCSATAASWTLCFCYARCAWRVGTGTDRSVIVS